MEPLRVSLTLLTMLRASGPNLEILPSKAYTSSFTLL